MNEQLPPPLVPPEVDLRGMEFMLLFGDRLFKSTTWIEASPEGQVAALRLWWHSYAHEVPAASLPDNDRLLAEHAGYGVAVKSWLKVKQRAMRGWVLCSDGRWYHKVVAELALRAWESRVRNRDKIKKWREKKGSANRSVFSPVRVTPAVTKPVGNCREKESEIESERESERESQGEREQGEPVAVAPNSRATKIISDERLAFDVYNETAERLGLSLAQSFDGRKAGLTLRLKECGGLDGWRFAMAKIEASSFLSGRSGRGEGHENWRCNLDFILKKPKFTKIMEGGYDDVTGSARCTVNDGLAGIYEAGNR